LLRLITIDLTGADLAAFEDYETRVLRLVPDHGGRVDIRVRALDGLTETHLLYFPDEAAFESYRSAPARLALSGLWEKSGARSIAQPVERVPDAD